MYIERFDRLNLALQAAGLDGIALNPGPSLTYLTGLRFHLMERPTVLLLVPGKIPVLVIPELELTKARSTSFDMQLISFDDNPVNWSGAFQKAGLLLGLSGKKIGVEPTRMRFLELQLLQMSLVDSHFVNAESTLSSLRIRKDTTEVEAIRQAVKIAQIALVNTLPMIKTGVTERQIASELTIQLLRAGTDPELPFAPIVSSGPHSADPHASPSERPIQDGDLIVIDWGASNKGYISDLTRTFAVGNIEPEFEKIALLVKQANKRGRETSRPGIMAGQVDAAARDVIEAGGYGPQFFHRVGHGIGMEGHEPPFMFGENPLILSPGMTYTVEPDIYLTGRGGVRIEDNVVITENGMETLSDLPRDLVKVG